MGDDQAHARLGPGARQPPRIRKRFHREIGLTHLLVRLSKFHVSDPQLRIDESCPPRVINCGRILASLESNL